MADSPSDALALWQRLVLQAALSERGELVMLVPRQAGSRRTGPDAASGDDD